MSVGRARRGRAHCRRGEAARSGAAQGSDERTCSLAAARRSTARMTASLARTPTTAAPFFTASIAYSTCSRWPSGEKVVSERSYDISTE